MALRTSLKSKTKSSNNRKFRKLSWKNPPLSPKRVWLEKNPVKSSSNNSRRKSTNKTSKFSSIIKTTTLTSTKIYSIPNPLLFESPTSSRMILTCLKLNRLPLPERISPQKNMISPDQITRTSQKYPQPSKSTNLRKKNSILAWNSPKCLRFRTPISILVRTFLKYFLN